MIGRLPFGRSSAGFADREAQRHAIQSRGSTPRELLCVAALGFACAASGFLLGRNHEATACEERLASLLDAQASLTWQLSMLRLRSFAAPGPITHSCLRESTLKLYGARDHTIGEGKTGLKPFFQSRSQVPAPAYAFMRYVKQDQPTQLERNPWVGRWVRNWSASLVDTLVAVATRNQSSLGPGDYPFSAELHYAALAAYPVAHQRLLVAGSISPWLEALVLSRKAASVTTVDWELPVSFSPLIEIRSMRSMRRRLPRSRFDAILSYSSIEHDGLGRYGDPINPFGDVAAMGEFAMLLKPRGLLYLGLPVGSEGRVSHGCRYYDHARFASLTEGWTLLATFAPPSAWKCCPYPTIPPPVATKMVFWPGTTFWESRPYGKDDWHYQPVFVLQKSRRAVHAALRRAAVG